MLCWIATLLTAAAATAPAAPPAGPRSLDTLCAEEPERVTKLFRALDLTNPELAAVRERVEAEEYPAACRALLDHYRARFTGMPLPEKKTGADFRDTRAEAALEDRFTFYGVTATVPHRPDGGLDWAYRGPTDDREWAWGLNRHSHLSMLLGAYRKTGNPAYARTIDWHLRDWVLSSPYPGEKSRTARWRGLEAALRMSDWAAVFTKLQDNPLLSPDTRILMLSSLPDHAHYLRHFHAGGGNWVTMEMNGLTDIALTWPEFAASDAWLAYALETMTPELVSQVYPDGVQKELTSHYHRVAAYNFERFADRLRRHGRSAPGQFRGTLERMWNYLALSMRPNGYGVLNNDADYDHTRPVLEKLAEEYGRADWRYVVTNGAKGTRPRGGPSVVFPWAGQAVLRSGWETDAHWAFFDVGPLGTGHVHYDKLHLSVAVAGRDVLADSGRYTYVGGPWRTYFTGSLSHNVLLVDGKPQKSFPNTVDAPLPGRDTTPGGGTRLEALGGAGTENAERGGFLLTPDFDFVRGVFRAGYHGVTGEPVHTRAVFHRPGRYWLVVDRMDIDRARDLTALWHFHPDCTVAQDGKTLVTTDADKGNLRLVPIGPADWNMSLVRGQEQPDIQGWYSRKYNSKTPATAAVCQTHTGGAVTFGWLLLPAVGMPQQAAAAMEKDGPDTVRIEVRLPDGTVERWRLPMAGDALQPEKR